MGRNREKNKRLPKGWAPSRTGVIYFRPTNGGDAAIVRAITGGPLSLRLGATHDEAAETFARVIIAARQREDQAEPGTVGEICHRARLELLPSIANLKTRSERARHIDELDKLFGAKRYARNVYEASRDVAGAFFRAMDAQRYLFDSRASRPVGANRAVRSWEILFQWGRAPWGLTEYNPCSGLMTNPEEPRRIVPEQAAIVKLYRELSPPARWMLAMIRYYGRRKCELVDVQITDAREDGLHLMRGKRAKEIILRWEPRLRRHWSRLMRWRASVKREGRNIERAFMRDGKPTFPALLNSNGLPLTVSGFNSERRRAMERIGLKGAFTFHDVRKTRADTLPTLDDAAHVLAHDDKRTTATKYRVGPHVIDLSEEVARNSNSRKVEGNSRKG